MLFQLTSAKKTMEIDVYTGYSSPLPLPFPTTARHVYPSPQSSAFASILVGDMLMDQILAMDTNQGYYEVGLSTVQKAGVAHKIDFRESLALLVLDQLLQDETYHGSLDFIFVAVDKENYVNYHRRLLNLVKVGGLIVYERPGGGPA
ncbi:hypothetical protein GW17_00025530 [Ensete ventricosum]|nr:hypothetical protein GW17_00025530 [Ensete ventricosum]RZR78659.1 hypothetical protein BHM03_00004077 [Ensete ventricosum]